jgi:hypothetical protein
MKPKPEPSESSEQTFKRLFPERAARGWDKNLKKPTLQELTEACRRFGDSEDLLGNYYRKNGMLELK